MYYVYVLKNEKGELYYGFTSDLKKRLEGHNKGDTFTTRGHQWELIYYEAYKSEIDARNREKSLKESGGARRFLKERIKGSITLSN